MTFLPVFKQHTNLWLFYQFSNDIQTYDFFTSFLTTYKPMTFLPVFKRHTNLWLFHQFSNDILTYDFFTSFQTTYKPMTFLPVFGRHTNLWLFHQFSNDILWLFYQFWTKYKPMTFFTSFQATYKPMTFLPVFRRQNFAHNYVEHRPCWRSRQPVSLIIWRLWVQASHGAWLFYQFSNNIQTYDFFTSFQTTY